MNVVGVSYDFSLGYFFAYIVLLLPLFISGIILLILFLKNRKK